MNRLVSIIIVLFCSIQLHAQDTLRDFTTMGRLDRISIQLEDLSQSTLPGLNENVDYRVNNTTLSTLLRGLAETHGLNVSVGNLPQVNVTNNFNAVLVKDLLYFLCEEYELDIRFVGSIMSIYQVEKDPVPVKSKPVKLQYENGLLTLDLRRDSLIKVAKAITQLTESNVSVGKALEGTLITGYIRDLPVDKALSEIAYANELELEVRGKDVYAFNMPLIEVNTEVANNPNQRNNPRSTRRTTSRTGRGGPFQFKVLSKAQGLLSVDASDTEVGDMLRQIADELDVSYLFFSEPEGALTGHFQSVQFEDFLRLALENCEATYTIDEGIYLIGKDDKSAINQYKVYRFKNRSVEGVKTDMVPADLIKGLTITEAKELNALIIKGSEMKAKLLMDFIEQIDVRVPNVLIEVILADIRKGASVKTGIKAGIGDSTVTTGGTIFPGVDMTLSSRTLNSFLEKVDKSGTINLGRVAPNFYATVQALEDNNFLNLRSTPKLSTLNGHKATLTIGQKVFYLIENQNITPGVNPIVSISPNYQPVEANLKIDITPYVSEHEDITLEIIAEFSDFLDPQVEGGPPGNATRKFESKIRIKNEEMIVLGGLEEARKSETSSGVPLLSRIPVLSWLFSAKSKDKSDTKLIVFIKPTISY